MGLPRGRNPTYTRRTWRLDAGDGAEGLVGKGLVSSASGGGKLLIIGVK
jgi:hypothetical protein